MLEQSSRQENSLTDPDTWAPVVLTAFWITLSVLPEEPRDSAAISQLLAQNSNRNTITGASVGVSEDQLGWSLKLAEGGMLGNMLTSDKLGLFEGKELGLKEGDRLLGVLENTRVGAPLGIALGSPLMLCKGKRLGVALRSSLGDPDSSTLGAVVGRAVGA